MRYNVAGLRTGGGGGDFPLPDWWGHFVIGFVVVYVVGLLVSLTVLHGRTICNFLLGWAIRPSVAKANNRLVALEIYAWMNDLQVTDYFKARRKQAWARCKWWNID